MSKKKNRKKALSSKLLKEKSKSIEEKQKQTEVVVPRKLNLWDKIYNASIYKLRIISLVFIIFGAYFLSLGVVNISRGLFELKRSQTNNFSQVNEEKVTVTPTIGSIEEGISTSVPHISEKVDIIDKEEVKVSNVNASAEIARGESDMKSAQTGRWEATNYKRGDIETGNYTVVRGDTLWEISEAVYGNGTMWKQILAANSSSIGFLPNGSQALIIPGQVLTIP